MTQHIDLPKGLRVIVEVDLHYWQGRLQPFQFLLRGERYTISRITRRRMQKIDSREMQHYWIKVENQKGSFELMEDRASALWTLRRVDETKRPGPSKPPKKK